jgi:hypothetical protein
MQPTQNQKPDDERDELDPGLEVADIEMLTPPARTFQRYWFDVDNLKPIVAVLPVENAPGWSATLDGAPHPLFSTGPDLIGVRIPRGAHRLSFQWKMPARHLAWVLVSLAAVLWVLGVWARAIYRRLFGVGYRP